MLASSEVTAEAIARAEAQAAQALESTAPDERLPLQVIGNVGVITISGIMTKTRSFFSFLFGGGYSMAEYSQAMDLAEETLEVEQVLLRMSSPGGTVAGTAALADRTHKLAQSMNVVTFGEDIFASAAYWVGSQAQQVIINKTALAGSLGVISMMTDTSEFNRRRGIERIPLRSGPLKSPGQRGEVITEEQRESVQREIDATARVFYDDVARGREISAAKVSEQWGSGELLLGQEAVDAGLADRVDTFQNVLDSMVGDSASAARGRGQLPNLRAASASGLQEESEAMANTEPDAVIEETTLLDKIKALVGGGGTGDANLAPKPEPAAAVPNDQLNDRLAALEKGNSELTAALTTVTESLIESNKTVASLSAKLDEQADTNRKGTAIAQIDRLVSAGSLPPAKATFAKKFITEHGERLSDEDLKSYVDDVRAEASLGAPSVAVSREKTIDQGDGKSVVIDMAAHGGESAVADPESLTQHAAIVAEVGEDDGTSKYWERYEKTAYRLAGDGSHRGGDTVIAGGA